MYRTSEMKILNVSFQAGRASETWAVCEPGRLATLLRGGFLAPAGAPNLRLSNLQALDNGEYTFVPPEEPLNGESLLHNLTLRFDLMCEGAAELTFLSISASHLDELLRQNESSGLVETPDTVVGSPRVVKREFSDFRSNTTYFLVPLARETLHSRVCTCCCSKFPCALH